MGAEVLNRIKSLKAAYITAHRAHPSVLNLSQMDEGALSDLGHKHLGNVAQMIVTQGIRKALPTLFGMEIRFGTDETTVG